MNKLLYITSCCLFLFAGCNDEVKEENKKSKAASEIVETSINVATQTPKTLNDLEELIKTEPLSEQELANWMPEELNGMPREYYNGSIMSQFGVSGAAATFKEKANTYVSVRMVDGAGEKGVTAIGPFIMLKNMEVNRESNDGYEKMVEENGIRASERYIKGSNKYRISFLYGGRYGVTIESENKSREEVWKAIEALNFEALQ